MTGSWHTPEMFQPHPNLGGQINRNIVNAELEGGVHLNRLGPSCRLEVRTRHTTYHICCQTGGDVIIDGHPEFCPTPVRARIHGSTWGGSMIWSNYIGRGMRMEFRIPDVGCITTSPVQEIRELAA